MPGAAVVARPVDLQHALPRGEVARRGDLLEQRLDVRAQKLGRSVAGLADEMKVPWMPVRMLEAESALAEIDLAGDPGVHHPLQRAVDGGAADLVVLAPDQIEEIVGAEMAFLAEKDVDDEVALARALATRRTNAVEIGGSRFRSASALARGAIPVARLDVEGLAAAAGRLRVRVADREAAAGDVVDEIDFRALQVTRADRVDEQADAVRFDALIGVGLPLAFVDHEPVLKARAAAALNEHTKRGRGFAFPRRAAHEFLTPQST